MALPLAPPKPQAPPRPGVAANGRRPRAWARRGGRGHAQRVAVAAQDPGSEEAAEAAPPESDSAPASRWPLTPLETAYLAWLGACRAASGGAETHARGVDMWGALSF